MEPKRGADGLVSTAKPVFKLLDDDCNLLIDALSDECGVESCTSLLDWALKRCFRGEESLDAGEESSVKGLGLAPETISSFGLRREKELHDASRSPLTTLLAELVGEFTSSIS